MPAFDPYERWLGIKKNSHSLTLYRLLALEPFENDPEVISNAAKRQSFHIREQDQTDARSDARSDARKDARHEMREKVLDQIALAKAVLLDPTQKRLYDSQLKAKLKAKLSAKQTPGKPPKRKPQRDPVVVTNEQNVGLKIVESPKIVASPKIVESPNVFVPIADTPTTRVQSPLATSPWKISPVLSMLGGVCAFAILFFAVMIYLAVNSTTANSKTAERSQANSATKPSATSPIKSQAKAKAKQTEPLAQPRINPPNNLMAITPDGPKNRSPRAVVAFKPIEFDPPAEIIGDDAEVPFFDETLFNVAQLPFPEVGEGNSHQAGGSHQAGVSHPKIKPELKQQRPILKPDMSLSKNRLGMQFRWCQPASLHKPVIGQPEQGFWISQTEITQHEWFAVMETAPWQGKNANGDNARQPATFLTYQDAVQYCQRLTQAEQAAGKLPIGWKYSLPTEAEWEYACCAGGDAIPLHRLVNHAWFSSDQTYRKRPQLVGLKLPNAWGLYDMQGNVAEFCLTKSGGTHIVRGGSCRMSASECLSTARGKCESGERRSDVGFRLVIVPAD